MLCRHQQQRLSYGLQADRIGLVALVAGGGEFTGAFTVAAFSDRIGRRTSLLIATISQLCMWGMLVFVTGDTSGNMPIWIPLVCVLAVTVRA